MQKTLASHPALRKLADAVRTVRGAGLYAVGGAVRDTLLKRTVKDLDVVVAGIPAERLPDLLRALGKVETVGKQFAVFLLRCADGTEIDVALPRSDASFGTGRYRDVAVRADEHLPIERDLERRDFTINALAWDVVHGTLIDPFHGQDDLSKKIIRAVGDPVERLQEDATRILRAVRLAVELGFTVDAATGDAIRKKLELLADRSITPAEVVGRELVRAFAADPVRTLDLCDDLGILTALMPEISRMRGCMQGRQYHAEGDVWNHTRLALSSLADPSFQEMFRTEPTPQLIFATLLHDVGKPLTRHPVDGADHVRFDDHTPVGTAIARDLCSRLKLTSTGQVDVDVLVWLIDHHLDILNLDNMRPSTMERTFLSPVRGPLLLQLIWADSRSSLTVEDVEQGRRYRNLERFPTLLLQLDDIRQRGYRNGKTAPLLNGNDLMTLFTIEPGPAVGAMLDELRDAQLNGAVAIREQAIAFLKQRHGR